VKIIPSVYSVVGVLVRKLSQLTPLNEAKQAKNRLTYSGFHRAV
jgi:hypothetical protein